jgi:protein SCO1/2
VSKTRKTVIGICLLFLLAMAITTIALSNRKEDIFINQMGKEVKLSDLKGKVVLMNFIYTSCPNEGCDLLSRQLMRVQLLLKDRVGKDLFLVSISIDPEKDTSQVLQEYASKHKADPNGWHFLTGDKAAVERMMKKYAVVWKTDPDGKRHHSVVIALIDREGKKVAVYDDYNYDTLKIVEDIKKLL